MTLRLSLVLDAEPAGLEQGVQEATQAIGKLDAAAKSAGAGAAATGKGLDTLGTSAQRTGQKVDGLEQQVTEARQDMAALGTASTKTAGDLGTAGAAAESAGRGTTAAASAANILRIAFAGLGIAAVVRQVTLMSDAWKQTEGALRLVTASAAEARQMQGQLLDVANDTRSAFGATVDLYARLARSSDELGLSQRELLGSTTAVGQAIKISGGDATSAQAALLQLGQAMASGVLRGEELNSVMEQAPRLARAIADGMGVTIGELRAMGAEGRLTAQAVVEAIQSQAAVLQDEFAQVPVTIGDAFVLLRNNATAFIGELDRATGASGVFVGALQLVANNLDVLAAAAGTGGAAYALVKLAEAMKGVTAASALASGRGLLSGLLAGIGTLSSPGLLGVLGVAAAAGGAIALLAGRQDTGTASAEAYDRAMRSASGALGEVPERATAAAAALGEVNRMQLEIIKTDLQSAIEKSLADLEHLRTDLAQAINIEAGPNTLLGARATADRASGVWPTVFTDIQDILDVLRDDVPETDEQVAQLFAHLSTLKDELDRLGEQSAEDSLHRIMLEIARFAEETAIAEENARRLAETNQRIAQQQASPYAGISLTAALSGTPATSTPVDPKVAEAARAHEEAFRLERAALEELLAAYRSAPTAIGGMTSAMADAERAFAARRQAIADGRGDDAAYIQQLIREQTEIDALTAAYGLQKSALTEAARLMSAASGGVDQLATRYTRLADLLKAGLIDQEAFAFGAGEIRTEGLDAYEDALRSGNKEMALAIEQQLTMQAVAQSALAGVTTATTGLMGQVKGAIASVLAAGVQAGGILAMIARAAQGLLNLGGDGDTPQGPDPVAVLRKQLALIRKDVATGSSSGGGGGGGPTDTFADDRAAIEAEIEAMQRLIQATQQGTSAYEAMKAQLDVEAELRRISADYTAAQRAEIEQLIGTRAAEAEQLRQSEQLMRMQADLQLQLASIQDQYGLIGLSGADQAGMEARLQTINQIRREGNALLIDEAGNLTEAGLRMADYAEEVGQASGKLNQAQQVSRQFGDVLGSFFKDLTSGSKTAIQSLQDLGQALIDLAMQYLVLQPLNELAGGLFASAGSLISAALGVSSAAGIASGAGSKGTFKVGHTGGSVAGLTATRVVDPRVFDDAPRRHSGGLVAGERAIIAREDEWLWTPEQMSNGNAYLQAMLSQKTDWVLVDQRSANAPEIERREERGSDGRRRMVAFIRDAVKSDIAAGVYDEVNRSSYGLTRGRRG